MSRLASLRLCVLAAPSEQPQIDFKDGLEQTHIRTLIQSNLVLPDDIWSARAVAPVALAHQRLTMRTSVLARLKSALFRSKS